MAGKPLALGAQIEGLTMNKSIAITITGALVAVAIVLTTDYWMLVRAQQAALGNASRWTVNVCERPGHRACRKWSALEAP